MNSVIWISIIGAGLVILGLVILWFMMDLLVRLTASRKVNDPSSSSADLDASPDLEHLQKAAAASTAVAIALLKASFLSSDKKVDQCLTAWQSANRQSQLHNHPHPSTLNRNDE